MNYVKKMCILRQIKQGFSGDGKTLSGLIKIEQYGKNLAVEVSIINFAPLVLGEYYCLLSDGRGKTEMLSLRGKSIFNILSDIDISGGFCGIICYVKTEVVPIAYGINGNGSYDWRAILNKTLPPVFPKKRREKSGTEIAHAAIPVPDLQPVSNQNEAPTYEVKEEAPPAKAKETPLTPPPPESSPTPYDDEAVATKNYFEEEKNERVQPAQANENAHSQSATEKQDAQTGVDSTENVHASDVLHPFKTDPDGYYLSVKRELDELFSSYPQDKTLCGAFRRSEWVRLRGSAKSPQYLVGAVYEEGRARYICYALAAENGATPPEEIKSVCAFVPVSPLVDADGFFVIFQSAATGECMKPPLG